MRARLPIILLLLVLCAVAVIGQADDIELYQTGVSTMPLIIKTILLSVVYLGLYTLVLLLMLSIMQRFAGFDADMLLWIGLLWLGGMVINYAAYAIPHAGVNFVAGLIALPMLFAWSFFLATRSFAGLTNDHALRVALIVALVCAPYFSPTWSIPLS